MSHRKQGPLPSNDLRHRLNHLYEQKEFEDRGVGPPPDPQYNPLRDPARDDSNHRNYRGNTQHYENKRGGHKAATSWGDKNQDRRPNSRKPEDMYRTELTKGKPVNIKIEVQTDTGSRAYSMNKKETFIYRGHRGSRGGSRGRGEHHNYRQNDPENHARQDNRHSDYAEHHKRHDGFESLHATRGKGGEYGNVEEGRGNYRRRASGNYRGTFRGRAPRGSRRGMGHRVQRPKDDDTPGEGKDHPKEEEKGVEHSEVSEHFDENPHSKEDDEHFDNIQYSKEDEETFDNIQYSKDDEETFDDENEDSKEDEHFDDNEHGEFDEELLDNSNNDESTLPEKTKEIIIPVAVENESEIKCKKNELEDQLIAAEIDVEKREEKSVDKKNETEDAK